MAQLWGGRFTKQTDQLVFDFNASITFDKRLFHEDVTGSIVHATMLAKQGILTEEERKSIVEGLTGILEDVEAVTTRWHWTCVSIPGQEWQRPTDC